MNFCPSNTMLLACAVAGATACGSSGSGEPAENAQERTALLTSVTDNVILPAYQRFAEATAALADAAETYAQAVGTPGAQAARTAVQGAFVDAFDRMQYAEVLQLGPYGAAARFAGGQNLRDEVYSWPVVNACQVDVKLVEEAYAEADFFDVSLVNVYGFDALEYLLFVDGAANSCPTPARINQDGSWQALSAGELEARRANYAAVVARGIATNASTLLSAWTSGFANELRGAGLDSATYGTSQEGLDALFASMFYVELQVKDSKLAAPLGISADCATTTCPELLESQYADLSVTAVQKNIEAFSDVYYGGPASTTGRYGFGDLLRASNATELAEDMEEAMALVATRAPLVVEPIRESLDAEPPLALHEALRNLTTLLKTQFVSVLALRVPNEGAADND